MVDDEGGSGAGLSEDELFKALGNETRMRILQALWAEFDIEGYMLSGQEPVTFEDLRRGTGIRDSGNFNYHLDKLTGVFVEATDEGYVFTPRGFKVMKAITTHASYVERHIEPREIADPCPFCGGTLVAGYEREFVTVECTDCPGYGTSIDEERALYVRCPGKGAERHDLDTMLDMGVNVMVRMATALRNGFCPTCEAETGMRLWACGDHGDYLDGEEACPECGSRFGVRAEVLCEACKYGAVAPFPTFLFSHPRMQRFFERRTDPDVTDRQWYYWLTAMDVIDESIASPDPVAVTYRFELDGDTLEMDVEEAEPHPEISVRVENR